MGQVGPGCASWDKARFSVRNPYLITNGTIETLEAGECVTVTHRTVRDDRNAST